MNSTIHRRTPASLPSKQGFALIATISVMVLLVMIALAMLSLSTIELRQQAHTKHQEKARANARLALMIALGDLQKYAGADRRVTAPASILGDSVAAQKKNWTTVWDTSVWDVKDPVNSRDSQAYMTALVSRKDTQPISTRTAATADLASAVTASDPDWISLVSDGSVGTADDHVYAQAVDVETSGSSGSYAYWIGDEGVKARFDVEVADDHSVETWASAGRMGLPMGTGMHKVSGLEAYTEYLPGGGSEDDLTKFLSFRSTELSNLDKAEIKKHFHHITTTHTGLLVDNRWGGIRRDLSTAFEMNIDDFGDIEEFNASEESNQTDSYQNFIPSDVTSDPLYYSQDTDDALGYLFEVPVDSSNRYRGPTWDLLRNHYRIYKQERNELGFRGSSPASSGDALVAHGIVPFSYTYDGKSKSNASVGSGFATALLTGGNRVKIAPAATRHGVIGGADAIEGDVLQATVQKLTPQLIRAILVYGLARDGGKYHVTIDPYFVFHNPYNRPLEFYSLSVDVNGMRRLVEFEVSYTDTSGNIKKAKFKVQSGNSGGDILGSLQSYRLKAPANGSYRLGPGEIKLMSVDAGRHDLGDNKIAIRLTAFEYNEGAGVFLGGSAGQALDVDPDSTLTVTVKDGKLTHLASCLFTRLLHPQRATGGTFDLEDVTTFTNRNNGRKQYDLEEISLIQHMRLDSRVPFSALDPVAAAYNQIPSLSNGAKYLCTLDMGLKDFGDGVAVMSDFNHRSLGLGNRDYDGGGRIAPNWEVELTSTDRFNLQLADTNSNAYWGAGKTAADGGSSRIVLFDLPRAPLASLAALQHADISMLNTHPLRAISNSRMQIGQTDQTKVFNDLGHREQIDISWAANEALWDRYYFSGMNWGSQSGQPFATQSDAAQALVDGEKHRVLANPRMTLVGQPGAEDLQELMDYKELGKHLAITGAFNVNSTSVQAWKAVLSSLSGREISYLSGRNLETKKTDTDTSPMSRFTTPAGWDDDDYAGFRALSDTELESLAEKMVEQVKLRGPFMGLSDFINRRLASGETGKMGAIQAAIDESGINSTVKIGSTSNRLEQSAPDTNEGMARHLSQGDILTPLAPIIATRSDTFVIRAYGDSKDAKGVIQARVWCEATVQRTPEWVEDTNQSSTVKHPDYPAGNSTSEPILRQWQANPDLPETCKTFGRRFKLQSFRWLSADEV